MSHLRDTLPPIVFEQLRHSRYLAANSNSILLQSDESRRQTDNVDACHRKLSDAIREAAGLAIQGETSAEQVKRVQNL